MFVRAYNFIINRKIRSFIFMFLKLIFRPSYLKVIIRVKFFIYKYSKIAEALFITECRPTLNIQEKSVPLKLLN